MPFINGMVISKTTMPGLCRSVSDISEPPRSQCQPAQNEVGAERFRLLEIPNGHRPRVHVGESRIASAQIRHAPAFVTLVANVPLQLQGVLSPFVDYARMHGRLGIDRDKPTLQSKQYQVRITREIERFHNVMLVEFHGPFAQAQ